MARGTGTGNARATKKTPKDTDVVPVTFSGITLRRLDALVVEGSYGVTRQEVIRDFVEECLRKARSDGHITDAEWAAPTAANIPSTGG